MQSAVREHGEHDGKAPRRASDFNAGVNVRPEGEWHVLTAPSRLLARGLGRFPLHLVAEDRAPVPVFGEGHAALDADPDPLLGWFLLPSEQPLQQ